MLNKKGQTEEEFLAQYDDSKYPKPSLTADNVIFDDEGEVLLIKRGNHPYIGQWALPGGFANKDEAIERTALRELEEETNIADVQEKLVGVYSKPHRDPRGWVVSVAFVAHVHKEEVTLQAGDDAASARWFKIVGNKLTSGETTINSDELAFDHERIIFDALKVK